MSKQPGMNPDRQTKPELSTKVVYWRAICRLTAVLLVIWGVVTFGFAYMARDLSAVFFGWPFGFWMSAQGALLIFLALVVFYAWAARRLDARYGDDE